MNIQWYPGHMAKTKRIIQENISLVDVVIELIDSRVPYSSKNPDIDELAKNKFRIIVMNKCDLADEKSTNLWEKYFKNRGFKVIKANSLKGNSINDVTTIAKELMKEKIERQKAKGRIFVPIRSMIVGIPNVGKSTFINKYVGKTMAKTGDRPGVTKSKQWIRIKKGFELLDTPGILWPKFEDKSVGLKLAFTGAINDNILDIETLGIEFINHMMAIYAECIKKRYNIEFDTIDMPSEILKKIGRTRGFILKGDTIDMSRTATILMDEYRAGKLGKITLELPENIDNQ